MAGTHREPRLVGYARISTYGQPLDNQLKQLRAAGCSSRNIYRENVTGAQPDRREFLRMFDRIVPGDVVTVSSDFRKWTPSDNENWIPGLTWLPRDSVPRWLVQVVHRRDPRACGATLASLAERARGRSS